MATSPTPSAASPPLEAPPSYQSASPFFTRLPYEIRQQIYLDCFRASGLPSSHPSSDLRQHILLREDGRFTHTPCITSPSSPDVRYAGFRNAPLASLERATWLQRLKTEWCLHWACEEAMLDHGHPRPRPSTFLPLLLTCKQTHAEALPTLYRALTFLFTDLVTAETFLFTFPHHPIRNIELSIRLSNLLTELYFPYAELAAYASAVITSNPPVSAADAATTSTPPANEGPLPTIKPARTATPPTRLTSQNNPWSRVCSRLITLSQTSPLSHLHIWLDTRDLRPWHKRVSETRMFGVLQGVRMQSTTATEGPRFVLALPEIPTELDGGAGEGPPVQQVIGRGLGGEHFLRGEEGGGGDGFVVVRGTRANNWSVHMGERVFGGGRM